MSGGESPGTSADGERGRLDATYRRQLYQVASDQSLSTDEKLRQLLAVGCGFLDLENGHIVAIDGDHHEIVLTNDETLVEEGEERSLEKTYCQQTMNEDEVLVVCKPDEIEGLAEHLEEICFYVGSKLVVGMELYGTICFIDRESRADPLTPAERAFVDLVGRWVSQVLEQDFHEEDDHSQQVEPAVEEIADYAVCLLDAEGHVRSWNTEAQVLHQYNSDEIIGTHVSQFYPERERTRGSPEKLLGVARTEGRVEHEGWRVRKDGSQFWVYLTIVALTDGEQFLGFGEIIRKQPDQTTTPRGLEPEQDFTARALDTVDDVFFVLNTDGGIERVNERVTELTGYSERTLLAMDITQLFVADDRTDITDSIDAVLSKGETSLKATLLSKDNQRHRLEFRARRLEDDDGAVTGIVGIGRDITEQELREERLEVAERVLRHNLRNDLNAIRSWTEYLQGDKGDQQQAIKKILSVTDRLIDLSEKTRTMSELDSRTGKMGMDVSERLPQLLSEFRALYPDAVIEAEIPPETFPVADGNRFETAIQNAIENAIEHNPAEEPWVQVRVASSYGQLQVHIDDDGPGIPEAERTVLEAGEETALEHGSGVGLWLIHWCVTTLGGDVTFTEREPTGSTVMMRIPLAGE